MKIITTAGLAEPQAPSPRKAILAKVREALRKQDATDQEYEDALEALIEYTRTPED